MNEDIMRDAAEVRGMLTATNDWRKALLIVRSVKRSSAGRPFAVIDAAASITAKISAREFAGEVNVPGFSVDTIRRTLAAWDRAAEAGVVPPASEVQPGQEIELPEDRPWTGPEGFYRHSADSFQQPEPAPAPAPEPAPAPAPVTATQVRGALRDPEVRQAAAEEIRRQNDLDHEVRTVSGGGRILSHEEINDDPPTALGAVIHGVEDFHRLMSEIDRATATIISMGPFGWDSLEGRALREHVQRVEHEALALDLNPNSVDNAVTNGGAER